MWLNIWIFLNFVGGPTRIQDEHREPLYYFDIIEHSISPYNISAAYISILYLEEKLSISQIAEKLGVSKSLITKRLHSLNIKRGTKKKPINNPKNYLAPNCPYGYRVVKLQLLPFQKEIKVCRLILRLINEEKLSYRATARKLVDMKIKNRKGEISWGHEVISSIYRRWNGKL